MLSAQAGLLGTRCFDIENGLSERGERLCDPKISRLLPGRQCPLGFQVVMLWRDVAAGSAMIWCVRGGELYIRRFACERKNVLRVERSRALGLAFDV